MTPTRDAETSSAATRHARHEQWFSRRPGAGLWEAADGVRDRIRVAEPPEPNRRSTPAVPTCDGACGRSPARSAAKEVSQRQDLEREARSGAARCRRPVRRAGSIGWGSRPGATACARSDSPTNPTRNARQRRRAFSPPTSLGVDGRETVRGNAERQPLAAAGPRGLAGRDQERRGHDPHATNGWSSGHARTVTASPPVKKNLPVPRDLGLAANLSSQRPARHRSALADFVSNAAAADSLDREAHIISG